MLESMSREDLLANALFTLNRDPGLIFWSLRTINGQVPPGVPPPQAAQRLPWCTCRNCQEMPTDVENLCCRQDPQGCISKLPHMNVYILQEGALNLAVGIWNDVRAQGMPQNPDERNRQLRYAGYRNFVMWQHGVLGSGNRVVVPSCCVIALRRRFPDSHGQYTGWRPSRV